MADGSLAVFLREVPPMSATRVTLRQEVHFANPLPWKGISAAGISIDENSGAIDSLAFQNLSENIVDNSFGFGLNSYIYVEGRDPANKHYVDQVSITYPDKGPLVNSIRIESDAPGTEGLLREVRFYNTMNRIDISNTIFKSEVYEPEGIHFSFPFNIPGGDVHINQAWDYYKAGGEQLPGSNLNYNTMSRWIDVSSDTLGVCVVSPDAPLVELGEISMDALSVGYKDKLEASQCIFSYVMNNYWETNFLAAQPGEASFRYSLYPHGGFDPLKNMKRALERTQPLIVLPSSEDRKLGLSLISFDNPNILITTFIPGTDNSYFLLRVYNPGNEDQAVNFKWNLLSPITVSFSASDLSGLRISKSGNTFVIRAHDFETIRVDL